MSAASRALALAVASIALSDDKRGVPGRDPTEAEIEAAVAAFMRANPIRVPQDGRDATEADVRKAVKAFFVKNPIRVPQDGKNASREMVVEAVREYLTRHPPTPGKDAREITPKDILKAVEEYFRLHPIPEPESFDDVKMTQGADQLHYTISFHHTKRGWIEAGTFRVPRAKTQIMRAVIGGDEAVMTATYDDYEKADTRPMQSGADDVKTFTFDGAVQLVKIHPLANDGTLPAEENRHVWAAADDDLTPAIGTGDPCPVGASEHLFGNRTLLKVWVPDGVDCFVTGYRRKAL